LRPRTLIIHDNLKKEIFFIRNIFQDEKINDYKERYEDIKNDLSKLIIQSSIINIGKELKQKTQNIKVKSNTTKKQIFNDGR
jgi:anthranilate synthase component 1